MNFSVESTHNKIITKFDYLFELTTYLINICKYYKFNQNNNVLTNFLNDVDELYTKYSDITSSVLSDYYDSIDLKNDTTKTLNDEYFSIITSENYINKLDYQYFIIKKIVNDITSTDIFKQIAKNINNEHLLKYDTGSFIPNKADTFSSVFPNDILIKLSTKDTIDKYLELYNDVKIIFQTKIKPINECECGANMVINPVTSYKICDSCGCQIYMPGTIFDDSGFFNQQICSKHKKYDSNRHCERWIKQIQAAEDISGTSFNKVIEILDVKAVKEYTKNCVLRSMSNMKCKQVREWLKDYKLTTKWNDHAPLIRKVITSLHGDAVVPPQLTKDEESEILIDFAQDMILYEKLSKLPEVLRSIDKTKIKNKPYYPFGLLKVLCRKLKGDPRLKGLIECIHFQSAQTNVKNDKIYKLICIKRNITYEPTDESILVDIK